jgi:hypothetical protein
LSEVKGEAPNHFRSVGFTLEPDEFQSLLQRAQSNGATFVTPHGGYIAWSPGAGAELWLNLETGRDAQTHVLRGVTPNFTGGGRMSAVVEGLERNAEYPLEGEMLAWSEPVGEAHGLYPFSATVPDFDHLAERELPFRAELAIAGFANDFAWWPSERDYEDAIANDETRFGTHSFVPVGLFGENVGRARSYGLVNGTLRSFSKAVNPATERPFVHARVETYGGEIDIVAPPDRVVGEPNVGAVVRATCWLVARVLAA